MTDNLSKRALIDQLQAERDWIERMVSGLSDEQMEMPGVEAGWSVKDIIAHLTVWDRRGTQWIEWARTAAQSEAAAVPLAGYSGKDVDRLNLENYHKNKDRPVRDVLRDFAQSFPPLLEQIHMLNEEDLNKVFQSDWTDHQPYPITEIVSWRVYHSRSHGKYIADWINRLNQDPGDP